jgi:aminoglycoside 2''-phosphotransferase
VICKSLDGRLTSADIVPARIPSAQCMQWISPHWSNMAAASPSDLDRIHEVMPGLPVSSLRTAQDGLVNDVLIVNEEWVFRFARTEGGEQALAREAELVALVGRHVSLRVPELASQSPGCLVYAFIPGVPLSRFDLLTLDARTRGAVLEQLGTFLWQLHGIPIPAPAEGTSSDAGHRANEDAEWLYEDLERELFPFMMAWARVWAREHFRSVLEGHLDLRYTSALIHGDLAPYHLCYDPDASRLVGVIDFGEAGAGDPAVDMASVINAYGESLLWDLRSSYLGLPGLIDRARFLAGTLELRWALAAIRSRDPAWFLCHLGSARDAWPVGWNGERGMTSRLRVSGGAV